ncbi:MAG: DegT/DnrJ/EryC1/StrS family aminotransferase [Candidatus Alcyoniella australis]|nr:DegT/DnrJ/EryC1/StrS family aminotransferase [Candidatus Alcyoniella australis]
MKIELYRHCLGHDEIEQAMDALQRPLLCSSDRVTRLESGLAQVLGVRHCVAVNNNTNAITLALHALDVGRDHEVILSPLSPLETVSAIMHAGAKPAFVDVEPDTGNINAERIEASITPQTKAIVPMHLYGQMADMAMLREIADRSHLLLIEDASHCLEGRREGVRPGQLSDAACLGFHSTANISAGQGAAIVLNDSDLAQRLRRLRNLSVSETQADRCDCLHMPCDIDALGFDSEMDDLRAALLLPQLRRIEELWSRRDEICKRYEKAFDRIENVYFPRVRPGSKSARNLFTIWVEASRRHEIIQQLGERGVGTGVFFRPLHLHTYLRQELGYQPSDFLVAESIGARSIALPLYPDLTQPQVEYVIEQVRAVV